MAALPHKNMKNLNKNLLVFSNANIAYNRYCVVVNLLLLFSFFDTHRLKVFIDVHHAKGRSQSLQD